MPLKLESHYYDITSPEFLALLREVIGRDDPSLIDAKWLPDIQPLSPAHIDSGPDEDTDGENTLFARACLDNSSIDKLARCLDQEPDPGDMERYQVTEREWVYQTRLALAHLLRWG